MGAMKDFDRRIRQGGDDAIAAVSEYVASLKSELSRLRHLVPPIAGTVDAESGMGFISAESVQCVAESMANYVTRGSEAAKGFEPRAISTYGFVKPRWIPVSERLPEHGEEVLGWQTSNVGDHWWPGVFVCHRWDRDTEHIKAGEWFSEEGKLWNITHWQPLPEPPSE